MRISDWSSDVCSSDLAGRCRSGRRAARFAAVTGGGADARSAHLPVMYAQVMEGLHVVEDGTYLDGTFGRGGHARGVLQRLGPGGRLLLMDQGPQAIAVADQVFGTSATCMFREARCGMMKNKERG